MIYRNLGNTGLMVSALSLGSWVTFKSQFDLNKAIEIIDLAYQSGVNFFDNAEVYGEGVSEEIMGKAFKKLGYSRSSYIISSKVFWGGSKPTQLGLSKKHVRDACDESLKRLGVDYLDLFYCHRPDPDTPIEQTVWAMNQLYNQGKILYWGTSEWDADQIVEAHKVARENNLLAPSMEQPQYNLFENKRVESDYKNLYDSYQLGLTTWSPLCSGILTGKYASGIPEKSRLSLKHLEWLKDMFFGDEEKARQYRDQVESMGKTCEDLNCSRAQLAIAWCLNNRNVDSVILGASSKEQLQENLDSLIAFDKITPEIITSLESVFSIERPSSINPKDF
jgi:voltage-dependent potassium channel beta subunit